MIYGSQIFVKTFLKLDSFAKDAIINRLSNYIIPRYEIVQKRSYSGQSFSTSQKYTTALPSPQEVTTILRAHEFNQEFTAGSVKSYDSNQLASNSPLEDTRAEALCTLGPGILMAVFDGHGGPSCAEVLSKRMLNYVAASLLPVDVMQQYLAGGRDLKLIETINDKEEVVDELKALYENSFKLFVKELSTASPVQVEQALERAVLTMDAHLSQEVLTQFANTKVINPKTLSVAISGAVACISYINGPNLHIANVGDCNAVLGVMTEENHWIAKKLTKEHNSENFDELKRIWNEHPMSERKTVIRRDRLLGELAPLRSLGDYRYKWPVETLQKVAVPVVGAHAIPPNYHTPPYLSAKPDVVTYRLTPKDKFLIIASDGIWDMMTPLQAVKLVGEHMKGKVIFNQLKLPQKNVQLGNINELLLHRKESLKSKPKDRNAATHLIRHAVGGTEYGVDHSRLAHLLSLAPDVSRMFRDDMTVTVVFFDSEFIRQCPA